ncbi:MAG TPA: MazG family protein [Streptosporangiaceae bacterium]|nr:MazG family protein [Streptosporangiaceae bacterium]
MLLATSPRVAPGQLTAQAWDTLRGARLVLAGSPDDPQATALADAGIAVQPVTVDGAAELAGRLGQETGHGHGGVVWLAGPEGDQATTELLAALGELPGGGPPAEVLVGSRDLPGAHLLDLVQTMDRLRTGCPWDAKQTHESLAPYLIEEAYEALDAMQDGDQAALREELGDVLLQVAFHARVAAERADGTGYTIDDVADAIVAKLVRRHPHVFAEVEVSGADEVTANWDTIKAAERAAKGGGQPGSALDGVPFGQPALALAAQLQRRAERAGVPAALTAPDGQATSAPGPPARATAGPGAGEDQGGAFGAELFRLVARAEAVGVDPELELRAAARRYRDRVQAWEQSR